jgi:V/A-type H+-transporting ATPase subunit K
MLAIILSISSLLLLTALSSPVLAAEASANMVSDVQAWKFLSMALAVDICSLGAAYAVAQVSVAALASAVEKPEILGRSLIFVGLAEGIAIYGLLVAFLIWITA